MGSNLNSTTFLTTIPPSNYNQAYFENISQLLYLTDNGSSVLKRPPAALVVHMTDYQHYLQGKLGLKIFFCVLLAFSSVMGTLGNILIILAILTEKFLRHPGNRKETQNACCSRAIMSTFVCTRAHTVFIINLAIADFFVTTFIDAFNIVGAVYGHSFYNGQQWLCELIAALCAPSCTASMVSLSAVALNR